MSSITIEHAYAKETKIVNKDVPIDRCVYKDNAEM